MEKENYEKLICPLCKEEFLSLNTEEEALKEAYKEYGDFKSGEEVVIVCEDCYDEMMAKTFSDNFWHPTS